MDLPSKGFCVIDTVLNLLFGCPHKRLTRPLTPVSKAGVPDGDTYVVCLESGKQFAYDWDQMRMGKPVALSPTEGVLDPNMPKPQKKMLRYAVLASAAPIGWMVIKALKRSEKPAKKQAS